MPTNNPCFIIIDNNMEAGHSLYFHSPSFIKNKNRRLLTENFIFQEPPLNMNEVIKWIKGLVKSN
uniref:Uncharacterized protein n=1 Tax=Strongyloides papillosus TaxID=174720 RepID=A0A0N5BX84_STREA